MFVLNDDLSVYVTRGDVVSFSVEAVTEFGEPYTFFAGDVVRITIYGKKKAEDVLLQKDFPVIADTEAVSIYLDKEETKIGKIISKPTDYWYEVELNPYTNPQTIIGYDEDGAKVFRLYPEGDDIEDGEPITPEDIPIVDGELDMTSTRPVENQAVARAVTRLSADLKETQTRAVDIDSRLGDEKRRVDNIVSIKNTTVSQSLEYMSYITAATKAKLDGTIKSDGLFAEITVNWREANQLYGQSSQEVFILPDACRPIAIGLIYTDNDGIEYIVKHNNTIGRYTLEMSLPDMSVMSAPSSAGSVKFSYALENFEVKDIRVGADGVTYPTAGDAVRGQIQKVNDAVTDKMEFVSFDPENIFNPDEYILGYVTTEGNLGESENLYYSPKIPVKEGDVFRVYRYRGGALETMIARFITAYDLYGNALGEYGADNADTYTVPSGVAYIVITLATAYEGNGEGKEITKNLVPTEYTAYRKPERYYKATPEFVGVASKDNFGLVKVWTETVEGENILHISTEV